MVNYIITYTHTVLTINKKFRTICTYNADYHTSFVYIQDYQYSYPSKTELPKGEGVARKEPKGKEKAARREAPRSQDAAVERKPEAGKPEEAERKRGTTPPEFLSYVPRVRIYYFLPFFTFFSCFFFLWKLTSICTNRHRNSAVKQLTTFLLRNFELYAIKTLDV